MRRLPLDVPQCPLLVTGATGTVGREVVRALLEYGAPVRVFVRSLHKVAALPGPVERFVGTLEDRDAVERSLRGVQAAFFISPHADAEERIAETFVGACERAGVRLVFAGLHADGARPAVRYIKRWMFTRFAPHYAGKMWVAERVRRSRTNPVVLDPGSFYQNEEIFREQILAGTYPMPLRLLRRVDARDVGDAAARVLLDPLVAPGCHAVVGPKAQSGEEAAANWSAALGREVRYEPSIKVLDRMIARHYTGRKAFDFQRSHRLMGRYADPTRPAQVQQTTALLGRPPRSHAEYVRDTAEKWRAAGAGAC